MLFYTVLDLFRALIEALSGIQRNILENSENSVIQGVLLDGSSCPVVLFYFTLETLFY